MNFIEKITQCYECIFYKQTVCFICGKNFCLYDNDEDIIPACSKGCMMEGLNNKEKREEREKFREKYGKTWKPEYIKMLKSKNNL